MRAEQSKPDNGNQKDIKVIPPNVVELKLWIKDQHGEWRPVDLNRTIDFSVTFK